MNWNSIQAGWKELAALWTKPAGNTSQKSRMQRTEAFYRGCGISANEARRKKRDWIRDPGVLDDWNDTRSILDM